MALPEFSAVRVKTDRYASEGVLTDAIGFILDAFCDGYLVEFSRSDGTTIALIVAEPQDIEPATAVTGQGSR